MPTYEYRCPEGHAFELFQRMSDEPKAACPACGADSVRKISGGAGFLFKGDGFYITDYRSDAYRSQAKKESGDSGGTSPSAPPTPASGAAGSSGASGSSGTSGSSGSSGSSAPAAPPSSSSSSS